MNSELTDKVKDFLKSKDELFWINEVEGDVIRFIKGRVVKIKEPNPLDVLITQLNEEFKDELEVLGILLSVIEELKIVKQKYIEGDKIAIMKLTNYRFMKRK